MSTTEERLVSLEQTVALLQKRINDADIRGVNHNSAMLLGIVSSQQMDVKDIKDSLVTIDDRLDLVNRRLDTMEQKFDSRFDQVVQSIAALASKLS